MVIFLEILPLCKITNACFIVLFCSLHVKVKQCDFIDNFVVARRKVVKSLEEQSRQLWHTSNVFLHPKIHEYAESKLAAKMPGNLKVIAVR